MSIKRGSGAGAETGNNFFNDYTTTNAFVELAFGFPAEKVSFVNDSDTDNVQISFDGIVTHYDLDGGEFKDLAVAGKTSVFVKATSGGAKVRINAQ